MPFLIRFLCFVLALSTLAKAWDDYDRPIRRRSGAGPYPLTNSSLVLSTSSTSFPESTVPTTSVEDLLNVNMQLPKTTSSFDATSGTMSSSPTTRAESPGSTITTSDLSDVYMQRPRTTSTPHSESHQPSTGFDSAASSSPLATGSSSSTVGRNSSGGYPINGTDPIRSATGVTTSDGSFNRITRPPANCSGTTTTVRQFATNRTQTVTEKYIVTVVGTSTNFTPPSTSTLPFCKTVTRLIESNPSNRTRTVTKLGPATSTCMGTSPCITIVFSTVSLEEASSTVAEFITTFKQTQEVHVAPTAPVSFDTTSADGSPPTPTDPGDFSIQGPTKEAAPTAKSTPSGGLGGFIASMFNNPFVAPKPSALPQVAGSGDGGIQPTQGSPGPGNVDDQSPSPVKPDQGSPGPGGSNGQSPSPVKPEQGSPPIGNPATGSVSNVTPQPGQGSAQPGIPNGDLVEIETGRVLVELGGSDVVVGGRTFPASVRPTTLDIDGQAFSINPSQVIASGITIHLPPAASGGPRARVNIAIESNKVVIGGQTYVAGSTPTSAVMNGQLFAVNPSHQAAPGSANTVLPVSPTTTPKPITVNNVPIVIRSDYVVIDGQTISPGLFTTSVVYNGQTFTVNPSQLVAPGTTISRPSVVASNTLSAVTAGGLTFSVDSTAAVISGTTFAIGANAAPVTEVIGSQTVSFGPNGVGLASATVPVPGLSQVTAGGLTFSVGSTVAVISGTTYTIGAAASPTTAVIGGQTVSFGPNGVGFASTTVPVPGLSQVTAGGLTFSVGSTVAVISGTTYTIGAAASPTTAVIGGQTVSFGPNGVGFASTTVPAATSSKTTAASPGLEIFVGSASNIGIKQVATVIALALGVGTLILL